MDNKEENPSSIVECHKQSRNSPFALSHLYGLLFCWFLINPFVLAYFSQFFHHRLEVHISNWPYHIWLLSTTILGPFTAVTEGRNIDFCYKVAFHILPICLGAIVFATTIQIFWRPKMLAGTMIRQLIWIIGWFIWFGGAMYSVLCNMG